MIRVVYWLTMVLVLCVLGASVISMAIKQYLGEGVPQTLLGFGLALVWGGWAGRFGVKGVLRQ
jgi:hypothetical protein